MPGRKTRQQQIRTFERKPDMPDKRREAAARQRSGEDIHAHTPEREASQSEFPLSRRGLHQESRDHNKSHDRGQAGHKPERESALSEKN